MISIFDFENAEYFGYDISENSLFRLSNLIHISNKRKYIDSNKNTLVLICIDITWIKEKAIKLFKSQLPNFPIKNYEILTLGHDELSEIPNNMSLKDYYDKCYNQHIIKQDSNSLDL